MEEIQLKSEWNFSENIEANSHILELVSLELPSFQVLKWVYKKNNQITNIILFYLFFNDCYFVSETNRQLRFHQFIDSVPKVHDLSHLLQVIC